MYSFLMQKSQNVKVYHVLKGKVLWDIGNTTHEQEKLSSYSFLPSKTTTLTTSIIPTQTAYPTNSSVQPPKPKHFWLNI